MAGMMMRLFGASAALVVVASLVACGGSKSSTDPTTTDDPNQTSAAPADGDPAATAAPPQAAAQTPPPSDAPPPGDAGAPAAEAGGGGGGPPSPQCEATSVQESGSNDTEATANAIPAATGTFCGSLDSATDVDVVSFTLPAGTKSLGFGLAYTQLGVVVDGTAGGESFVVGGKPAFKPGQKYVLTVHSSGPTPVSYLLSVDIEQ
jgi:hypothetical protein